MESQQMSLEKLFTDDLKLIKVTSNETLIILVCKENWKYDFYLCQFVAIICQTRIIYIILCGILGMN